MRKKKRESSQQQRFAPHQQRVPPENILRIKKQRTPEILPKPHHRLSKYKKKKCHKKRQGLNPFLGFACSQRLQLASATTQLEEEAKNSPQIVPIPSTTSWQSWRGYQKIEVPRPPGTDQGQTLLKASLNITLFQQQTTTPAPQAISN